MEPYLSHIFFDLAENGFVSRLPNYRESTAVLALKVGSAPHAAVLHRGYGQG